MRDIALNLIKFLDVYSVLSSLAPTRQNKKHKNIIIPGVVLYERESAYIGSGNCTYLFTFS